MDDNSRNRQSPIYPVSNQRFPQGQGQGGQAPNGQGVVGQTGGRGFAGSSDRRYRPAPLQTSSTTGRGLGGSGAGANAAAGGYGYYNEGSSSAFAGNGLPGANPMQQYQTDYTTSEQQQRQQQQQPQPQSFANHYNQGIMYNVPQQAAPTVYDAQQFQARQPAAMQMLSDVAAPYFPGEAANTAQAPGASVLHHQQVSSASAGVYQQNPADRSSLLQAYNPNNLANMSGIPQNGAGPQPGPAEMMDDQQQPQTEFAPGSLEDAYDRYHTTLKGIFQNIRGGVLVEASQSLLQVSDWLLSNVGELGLTNDDQDLHSDRINLWNEFNTAWLAVLQKQKDMTLELLETGHHPRHPQSMIATDFLERMGKDLVRFCDAIEKFGLVDYQYGVGEEDILHILTECLDLLESEDNNGSDPGVVVNQSSNTNMNLGRSAP